MSSLFSGAFSTAVGAQIERATKEDGNPERLSGLHSAICSEIESNPDGPRDAVKALKKRLFNNKNWRIVLASLSLLELLCRECGRDFTLLIAHRDFLNSLLHLTLPKSNSPTVVRDFVLLLFQKWASDYRNVHELVTMCAMYETLKQKGTEFPSRELGELVPLLMLSRDPDIVGEEARQSAQPPSSTRQNARNAVNPSGTGHWARGTPPGRSTPPGGAAAGPEPVAPTTQQEAKLRGELEIVTMNTDVMKALLEELTPGSENLQDFTLLQDLNSTCRTMRSRIVELIDCLSHDELICDLLMANDNLNNAFTSYDGFMARRSAMATTESADDLGAPGASGQQVGDVQPLSSDMSLLNMDSIPQSTAAPVAAMSLAQPTAQVEEDDDGFDSFAASRGHSMAPAAIATQPAAQVSRNPFAEDIRKSPSPDLMTQPGQDIQPVTSSEFDDFLALRANPPSQPAAATTTASVNLFDPTPIVPTPAAGAGATLPATSSQDAALQDLLNFAAPAPTAAMQSQPPPGNRPAMQTHDPTDGMFGF